MSFFVHDAMAAATSTGAAHAAQADGSFSFIMIGVIFVLFYFMLIRPQNKRAKEHRQLLEQLQKGDEVVVAGGILAQIVAIEEQQLQVNIAKGVEINVQRSSVTTVLPKGSLKHL